MSRLERLIVLISEMKDKQHIEKRFKLLLEKFQVGNCTPHELNELQAFFYEEALSSEIENMMYQELDHQGYSEFVAVFNDEKLFKSLELQIDENKHSRKVLMLPRFYRFVSVAAIIVLLFMVSGLTAYFMKQKIAVENLPVTYSEVVAPLGAKSQVILPDGSVVWLNAGSKLIYSNNFNLDNRLVRLEGEAYFQVAKNNKQPFVVDAFGFLVEGGETEFNVKAYEDEPTIEAILVEGKVWLNHRTETIASDIYLGRKYKATFYKQPKGSVLKPGQPRLVISPNVDPKPLISWKNDRFYQKSESLDNLTIRRGKDMVILYDLDRKNADLVDWLARITTLELNIS